MMCRIFKLGLLFWALFAIDLYSQMEIDIVYPKEGAEILSANSAFIFGSVKPAHASFYINARKVNLYPNGAKTLECTLVR